MSPNGIARWIPFWGHHRVVSSQSLHSPHWWWSQSWSVLRSQPSCQCRQTWGSSRSHCARCPPVLSLPTAIFKTEGHWRVSSLSLLHRPILLFMLKFCQFYSLGPIPANATETLPESNPAEPSLYDANCTVYNVGNWVWTRLGKGCKHVTSFFLLLRTSVVQYWCRTMTFLPLWYLVCPAFCSRQQGGHRPALWPDRPAVPQCCWGPSYWTPYWSLSYWVPPQMRPQSQTHAVSHSHTGHCWGWRMKKSADNGLHYICLQICIYVFMSRCLKNLIILKIFLMSLKNKA